MQRIRVLVGGILEKDGKILVLKRNDERNFLPGYWEIPGGKVEEGEDPNEAVVREVREETGLDSEIIRPYYVWSDVLEVNGVKEHIIQINYIMEPKYTGSIKLFPREHSEYKWIEKGKFPEKMSDQIKETLIKAFPELEK